MIKNFKKLAIALLLLFTWSSSVVAADKLPEVMVGQTQVTFSSTPTGDSDNPDGSSVVLAKNGYIKVDNQAPDENTGTPSIYNLGGRDKTDTYWKPFAVMAWIKPANQNDPVGTYETILSMGDRLISSTNAPSITGWAIGLLKTDATHYQVMISAGNASQGYMAKSDLIASTVLFDNNWHHIMFSLNLSAAGQPAAIGFDQTYKAAGNSNLSNGTINGATPDPIYIGNESGNYAGQIDEVRIYDDVVMTSTDFVYSGTIDNALENGQFYPEKMIARWMFDEGKGTVGNIVSGINNQTDGTIMAGVTWGDNIIPLAAPTGSTTVTSDFYGGFTGNEVVFNSSKNTGLNNASGTDELFGFKEDPLVACITAALIGTTGYTPCFQSNVPTAGIKVMPSRTSVNGVPLLETSALNYPQQVVVGDAYGSLDNFAFWGRNLHAAGGTAGSDASWTFDSYAMDPNAQAKWGSAEFLKNNNKIAVLEGEAPAVNTDIGSTRTNWYLQTPTSTSSSTMLSGNTNAEIDKYPEGKVWKVDGNLTLDTAVRFYGKGTIIVNGNLTINKDILPATTGENRLGFIVLGTATIPGVATINNSKVQASIYCPGTISVGSGNNILTGSFVASAFNISSSNARFYYDYDLDSAWPPGFRLLNMPHPDEVKQ